jgi:glycosyltransferase involved in cell wall biosynthesis
MSTAAVLVTHDAEPFIAATITSVLRQTQLPDLIVIIDDASTDATLAVAQDALSAGEVPVTVVAASTQASDVLTRIAQNFMQGVRAAQEQGADVVVLGDHDDLWHAGRVEHQVRVLEQHPRALLVASDGTLLREGDPTDATLRDTFPVPVVFNDWRASQQFGYTVRHSVATGGACAIRPNGFQHFDVPEGWLHDRWWSLAAAAHHALVIDPTPVIDYRISSGQQIGLETAAQGGGAGERAVHFVRNLRRSVQRTIDLVPLYMASR